MRAMILDSRGLMRQALQTIMMKAIPCLTIVSVESLKEMVKQSLEPENYDLMVATPSAFGPESATCIALLGRLHPKAKVILLHDGPLSGIEPEEGRVLILPTSTNTADLERHLQRLTKIESRRPIRDVVQTGTMYPPKPETEGSWLKKIEPHLSRRQREIMVLVAAGFGNIEISSRLGVAEGTVKSHLHTIFRVLNVRSRTQAALEYQRMSREYA